MLQQFSPTPKGYNHHVCFFNTENFYSAKIKLDKEFDNSANKIEKVVP